MSEQSKLGLGQIITTPQHRDAIHVAVAPVIASHDMGPGMHVGLTESGEATNHTENAVGIVDPFLKQRVLKGEQCWLFIYPGTITNLRHEWKHPAFGEQERAECDRVKSEEWLRAYAVKLKPYETDGNKAFSDMICDLRERDTIYSYGSDLHSLHEFEDAEDFFYHAEIYLGRKLDREEIRYTCSC